MITFPIKRKLKYWFGLIIGKKYAWITNAYIHPVCHEKMLGDLLVQVEKILSPLSAPTGL
jgi:hypothetical protein